MEQDKKKHRAISLRTVNSCLIIGAVIMSGLMFFSTFRLSGSFRRVTEASEQQIELRKAARELMDASDYLTEKVQRFTAVISMTGSRNIIRYTKHMMMFCWFSSVPVLLYFSPMLSMPAITKMTTR